MSVRSAGSGRNARRIGVSYRRTIADVITRLERMEVMLTEQHYALKSLCHDVTSLKRRRDARRKDPELLSRKPEVAVEEDVGGKGLVDGTRRSGPVFKTAY